MQPAHLRTFALPGPSTRLYHTWHSASQLKALMASLTCIWNGMSALLDCVQVLYNQSLKGSAMEKTPSTHSRTEQEAQRSGLRQGLCLVTVCPGHLLDFNPSLHYVLQFSSLQFKRNCDPCRAVPNIQHPRATPFLSHFLQCFMPWGTRNLLWG